VLGNNSCFVERRSRSPIRIKPASPKAYTRVDFFPPRIGTTLSEEGRAWFPYFRLYSPKKTFLDRTWVLPDIEKVQ
jgi:hypothetical protein